ncbi:rhomboid family intramembrane serine protease [Sandarakinorhabdus sp. DWP1-3-1]|uniref:rhomboid family intramembrane serine protease n=1 Tax=Sandarakinorhabdus sp. DWP1-3-1 TaxID=2804627 RepID=UPI003CEFBA65
MKPFKPPTPIATNSLIGLCVVVQVATALAGTGFADALHFNFGLIPARITAAIGGRADAASALATLLTHVFLHGGWLHLGLNVLFLAWVGRYVEWVTGRAALIAIFLAGGIIGGITQVLAGPADTLPVVGASGAIAAVFGAYAVLFAQSRVASRRLLGLAISGETLTALWYAATWIALQLLTAVAFQGGGMQVAIWTHIGGFITGLLIARIWGRGPQPF